jgi:hypothetical protein
MKKLPLLTAVLSALAFAGGLKPAQEEAKAKMETETADRLKELNEKCGTKAVVKSDFENFHADEWKAHSYSSYCADVMYQLSQMCERPAYKSVLGKQLNSISCLFGNSKPKSANATEATVMAMSYQKGTFTYRLTPEGASTNIGEAVTQVMEKALNE